MKSFVHHFSVIHRQSAINIERRLKKLGLPYGQYMYILCICDNKVLSQEKLSCELQIDKGSVARTVKQLEQSGYITRRVSNEDKRQNLIKPTEKAFMLYGEIISTINEYEKCLTKDLSDIEKNVLTGLLTKLIDNLEACGTKRGPRPAAATGN